MIYSNLLIYLSIHLCFYVFMYSNLLIYLPIYQFIYVSMYLFNPSIHLIYFYLFICPSNTYLSDVLSKSTRVRISFTIYQDTITVDSDMPIILYDYSRQIE
jgi:hypothetical protein